MWENLTVAAASAKEKKLNLIWITEQPMGCVATSIATLTTKLHTPLLQNLSHESGSLSFLATFFHLKI